jgi:hypothetical protein
MRSTACRTAAWPPMCLKRQRIAARLGTYFASLSAVFSNGCGISRGGSLMIGPPWSRVAPSTDRTPGSRAARLGRGGFRVRARSPNLPPHFPRSDEDRPSPNRAPRRKTGGPRGRSSPSRWKPSPHRSPPRRSKHRSPPAIPSQPAGGSTPIRPSGAPYGLIAGRWSRTARYRGGIPGKSRGRPREALNAGGLAPQAPSSSSARILCPSLRAQQNQTPTASVSTSAN